MQRRRQATRAPLLLLFLGVVTLMLVAVTCRRTATDRPAWLGGDDIPPGGCAPDGRAPVWALMGDDDRHLAEQRRAGVCAKVIRLSWRAYIPAEGQVGEAYVAEVRTRIERARAAGFAIILETAFHDTPAWVHERYADSYYVNQYGDRWTGDGEIDNGDANIIFNDAVKALVVQYLRRVFADLGTEFAAVRLGGGKWGELTYPPSTVAGRTNAYWAFDANALRQSPVPTWRPGEPSPHGEAALFLEWYLDTLVRYQNWQIATLRTFYAGPIMMLYPSWGVRPGQIAPALATDLDGSTPVERNAELQRGFDFARQVAALADPEVIVTTTWLDADPSGDATDDPRRWSPVKYLATLAAAHPLQLNVFGENTGKGDAAVMGLAVRQMRRYRLVGLAWYGEAEMYSGRYATLADFRAQIAGR